MAMREQMKKIGKLQQEVLELRAICELFDEEFGKKEANFCKENNYRDEIGNPAKAIFMIADEDVFNEANEKFSSFARTEWNRFCRYREAKEQKEKDLVIAGLDLFALTSPNDSAALKKQIDDYIVFTKLLEATMRLDTKTISARKNAYYGGKRDERNI